MFNRVLSTPLLGLTLYILPTQLSSIVKFFLKSMFEVVYHIPKYPFISYSHLIHSLYFNL